jgi:hypothetical protein
LDGENGNLWTNAADILFLEPNRNDDKKRGLILLNKYSLDSDKGSCPVVHSVAWCDRNTLDFGNLSQYLVVVCQKLEHVRCTLLSLHVLHCTYVRIYALVMTLQLGRHVLSFCTRDYIERHYRVSHQN